MIGACFAFLVSACAVVVAQPYIDLTAPLPLVMPGGVWPDGNANMLKLDSEGRVICFPSS